MSFSLSPIKTEAYIQRFKKRPGAEAGSSWRHRLGLGPEPEVIPPWEHRPSQQVAVLGSDLNLF